jgi:ParB family chromosome partitioning protein
MANTDGLNKPKKLGRGLSSLLGGPVQVVSGAAPKTESPSSTPAEEAGKRIAQLAVGSIVPSPYQPRHVFDEASLAMLADSIRTSGVMQPILVRRNSGGGQRYELIAGERRLRAAQRAGLAVVPSIISEISDQEAAEWSLTENLQREDLNPLDKGYAFKRLSEQFGLTQVQIAERLGVDRYSVANHIRITELEPEIQDLVRDGKLAYAHARALLAAPVDHPTGDPSKSRISLAQRAVTEGWTVRKIDHFAAAAAIDAGEVANDTSVLQAKANDMGLTAKARALARDEMEKQLSIALGTNVSISGTTGKNAKGKITIEFYSLDQFDGLLKRMGTSIRL